MTQMTAAILGGEMPRL